MKLLGTVYDKAFIQIDFTHSNGDFGIGRSMNHLEFNKELKKKGCDRGTSRKPQAIKQKLQGARKLISFKLVDVTHCVY